MGSKPLGAGLATALVLIGTGLDARAKKRAPVATGEYRVLLSGRRVGQETFSVFKAKSYEVRSQATLYWPEPRRFEVRYVLGPSFRPEKLEVKLTRGGRITKMKLKRRKNLWRSEVEEKGRHKLHRDLGDRQSAEVDFDSPLFNGFILRRLSLHPGEERATQTVVFHLSDLIGERRRQTYRRLEDALVETPATGRVTAAAYELVRAGQRHQLWTNASGVVLLTRVQLPEGKLEYELVRLDARRGAWQPIRK